MTDRLTPRGPDAQGIHQHNGSVFGHRRLSIQDLSDRANQPMIDTELNLGIVYNGEIYNFKPLRRQLQQLGYTFRSDGDTEVLLKAYHAWGEDFVTRCNGMFAFAIWDQASGKVVMGRDRLGIKPLYYSLTGNRLRFASTLPAILDGGHDGIDTSIDPVALHYYMHFHAVVPAPHTMLRGIRKLPPATIATIEPGGKLTTRRYWQADSNRRPEDAQLTERDWQDLVLEKLRESVKRRLIADVPVGVLLSGGLDSSLIVGLLAEKGQADLNTFSIGFESINGEAGDEFIYSDVIAERFNTIHHRLRVDSTRALGMLPRCIEAMAEPMVSHDVIGFYLLSEEVAKHVKVVQSGQGADEVFAGYHWYPPLLEREGGGVDDYANVFFDRDHADFARAVNPSLVDRDFSREFVADHFGAAGADRLIDKAFRLDTTIMLVDDPVKRVDNMTMAWGLEARVPFLDHELVELAGRIPPELKVAHGGKGVLKEAARRVIPSEVIDRPKGYFPVPALKYLRGDYLEAVRDVLDAPAARQRGLFNRQYVDELLGAPDEHITRLRGSKLWQVALLEWWLQIHNV